jgi:GTP-binding protein
LDMSQAEFTVALVGRPNVGKSTLFNRIAGKRRAITFDQPGITRDLVAMPVEYDGRHFMIIDTGGYVTRGDDDILQKVRAQVLRAIFESDLVVFLVDSRDGLLPLDKEIAVMLRERDKPFLLTANKVDAKEGRDSVGQFHELSVDKIIPFPRNTGRASPNCSTRSWRGCRRGWPSNRKRATKPRAYRRSRSSGAPTWGNPPW